MMFVVKITCDMLLTHRPWREQHRMSGDKARSQHHRHLMFHANVACGTYVVEGQSGGPVLLKDLTHC